MAYIHFMLQGKGGVGKSLASSFLIQYLLHKNKTVSCIDTDPVNATLGGYKEFSASIVNIMKGDNIDAREFDGVLEAIFAADEDQHIVIDNGASSFIPLMAYLKENDALSLIQENGHHAYLHTIITGGQAILDTLNGLKTLCENFATAPMVVWLNLFFGDIALQGKSFDEFTVYKNFKKQFSAIVTIPNKNKATYGKDVEELLARKESFNAGINSSLPLMVRQRLKTYQKDLFEELDRSGVLPA